MEPSKDAFTLSGSPDTSYGLEQLVIVGHLLYPDDLLILGNSGYCETFLSFDLSSLSNLEEVTFVFVGAIGYSDGFSLEAFLINSAWDEFSLTWNNKPPLGALIDTVILSYDVWGFPKFDLTGLTSGNEEITICLRAPGAFYQVFYSQSREMGDVQFNNVPYLQVTINTLSGYIFVFLIIAFISAIFIYVQKFYKRIIIHSRS
jgi:hypothetical protein